MRFLVTLVLGIAFVIWTPPAKTQGLCAYQNVNGICRTCSSLTQGYYKIAGVCYQCATLCYVEPKRAGDGSEGLDNGSCQPVIDPLVLKDAIFFALDVKPRVLADLAERAPIAATALAALAFDGSIAPPVDMRSGSIYFEGIPSAESVWAAYRKVPSEAAAKHFAGEMGPGELLVVDFRTVFHESGAVDFELRPVAKSESGEVLSELEPVTVLKIQMIPEREVSVADANVSAPIYSVNQRTSREY